MKGKIVRTLVMTVAAISLLSVSAYAATTYNTSRIAKTANRILDGTEREGAATVLQGGADKIQSTNELTDPEKVRITYNYDGKSEKDEQTVRTTKWTTSWSGVTATHTQIPYTVKTKSTNYVYWRVTKTNTADAYKTREIQVSPNNSTLTKAPTAKNPTYSGGAQQLVNAGTASNGTVYYKLNSGSWSTGIPTATNAGSYTVSYYVKGNAKFNNTATASVTVKINTANSSYTTEPAAKELTYTSAAQALVTAGAANGGEVQYSLDNSNWSTDIPTAADAGDYTVYYKVVGDANHNDIAEKSVKVTINKADASFTTEPAAQSLTWTGEAQALVTAGAANGGEVQYSLDNINWSTAIPTATAVDTYTVYYKIAGDADHNDTAVNSVTVTIGAKAAEATYKNAGNFDGDEYDGKASAWTVTVTPGSTAIQSVDVKVNDKNSTGQWNNNTAISDGPVIFGVVVNAAATEVTSMTAVVNGVDVPATPYTAPID